MPFSIHAAFRQALLKVRTAVQIRSSVFHLFGIEYLPPFDPFHIIPYVLTSRNGGIYGNDHEALEALNLVAEALGQSLTVQVIER
jgi:hypothetical protein